MMQKGASRVEWHSWQGLRWRGIRDLSASGVGGTLCLPSTHIPSKSADSEIHNEAPDMVTYNCNPSMWEAERQGDLPGQPGPHYPT